eukprot:TRINITY_DN144_c0_g1_i1.p1 TRINITY_DN144_c0_g1~~TRINITY_DN144_c0_g1_i1.p1  ORF type:complete len:424 (+),score=118.62 TRINITY_DN144_c0_g1_i1:47-1318(+)
MLTKVPLMLMAAATCPLAMGFPTMAGKEGDVPKRTQCPGELHATPVADSAPIPTLDEYNAKLKGLDIKAVIADVVDMLTKSQDCWPADHIATSKVGTSYGGLFVRLAWHCSGSYRHTDGRGGCGGGRQRFQPENSWTDNTNLDKARGLLWPIKEKYGDALSWGDLFILAGTGSILHMGGPVTEICAGRIDDADGNASKPLGPGPEQPACPIQGDCKAPLGTSTVGLIYVNPEGFMGVPDAAHSALEIRDVFTRMGMNDTETVALIGGGHAFGRTHGACPKGAGPSPKENPSEPWPGLCGTGKGLDTFTSGIEGPWTTDPFAWDNQYFTLLDTYGANYTYYKGAGGKYQWHIPEQPKLMMMTTDVALTYDAEYKKIVHQFATDMPSLENYFSHAWEKLTTDGAVWAQEKKCWKPDTRFKSKLLD